MPTARFGNVLRFLYKACGIEEARDVTDRELLEKFLAHKDENAFAILVERHGPMVFSVCRRVLGNADEAEDVFQATFLVLVRRMRSIGGNSSIGGWLHEVARRIALKARTQKSNRRQRETEAGIMRTARSVDDLSLEDLRSALDEEIASLPEKHRAPIVLCYLEGKTYDQAARELGCTKISLARRLARARELLRRQLERRGIGLAAAAVATSLAGMTAAAPLPGLLTIKTVKAAALVAGGKAVAGVYLSARALALAEEAITGLLLIKGKLVVMVLVFGLAVGAAGWAGYQGLAGTAQPAPEANAQPPAPEKQAEVPAKKGESIAMDQFGDPLPDGAVARLGARRFRHDGPVALAYTPDGKTLVGLGGLGVILWDATTGEERRRLHGPLQTLLSHGGGMAVSPDGATLAIADSGHKVDSKITLWDLATGNKTRTLSLPKDEGGPYFYHVCYAPDGKSLAWGNPGKVLILDLPSGQVRTSMGDSKIGDGNSLALYDFAISPDSKTLATAVRAKHPNSLEPAHGVQLWDMATGKPMRAIHALPAGAEENIHGLAFSPDNRTLAFGFKEQIYLADAATGTMSGELDMKAAKISNLVFAPDGKKLIALGSNRKAIVWDLVTFKILHAFDCQGPLSVAPDGNTLALGFANSVRLWNLATGKELCSEYGGHRARIWELAFSPDGKELVSAGIDDPAFFWDTASKERKGMLPWKARSISYSPDGKMLATVPFDSTIKVRIWDASARKEALEFTVPDAHYVSAVFFSPDSRNLFTWDHDKPGFIAGNGTLRQWDLATAKPVQLWRTADTDMSNYLTITLDGKAVHAGRQDGAMTIFDKEMARARLLDSKQKSVRAGASSPDARILAAGVGAEDRDIRLWEIATGKLIFDLAGNKGSGGSIAWSPDGRLVAGGDRRRENVLIIGTSSDRMQANLVWQQYTKDSDQSVLIWDTATGKELVRFSGFQADVFSLAFSPSGTQLAAGLSDSTILIWDVTKIDPKWAPAPKLGEDELNSSWALLAGDNATQAHQAVWTLVISPRESLPFLRNRLKPIAATDAAKVQQWIADLSSDILAVRQAASNELEKAGDQVQGPIQKALQNSPPLETRLRLEQILKQLPDTPGPDTLRTIRAIMVLERIGSSEARAVLETMARGAPGARAAEEAKGSLARLARRVSNAR